MYPNYISFNNNVINSIGMIVGFLPVGLPSAVTLVLVIVAVRIEGLSRRKLSIDVF